MRDNSPFWNVFTGKTHKTGGPECDNTGSTWGFNKLICDVMTFFDKTVMRLFISVLVELPQLILYSDQFLKQYF